MAKLGLKPWSDSKGHCPFAPSKRGQSSPSGAGTPQTVPFSSKRSNPVGQKQEGPLPAHGSKGTMPRLGNTCEPLTALGAWAAVGTSPVGAAGCLHGSGSCRESRDRAGTRPCHPWPLPPALGLMLTWEHRADRREVAESTGQGWGYRERKEQL